MGKKQHSKDKLYVTRWEMDNQYGGKRHRKTVKHKKLSFNLCSLSLQPFKDPVCTSEGDIFDLRNIVPYIKRYGKNPINGKPLAIEDLITLKFHKNEKDIYFCPVSYKEFTDHTKICVNALNGQVYAYDAVYNLNIKSKFWEDLMDGSKFKPKDIIILQDPHNFTEKVIDNFEYSKRGFNVAKCMLTSFGKGKECRERK